MKDFAPEFDDEQPGADPRVDPVSAAENAHMYQRLVQEIRDYAIFMLDRNGFIRTWSAGAERMKGYKAEEIIGQHFSRFFTEEDVRNHRPEHEIKLALSQGRMEGEGWRVRKDGTRFWANVIMTPIYDESGQHVGFAKITRDLTERRAAEEALREELTVRRKTEDELRASQAELEKRVAERTADFSRAVTALAEANQQLSRVNRELEQASRTKDQFLAVLSHELRTPLTSIYGWLTLLQAGKVDPAKLPEVFRIMERNVKAQTQLVDDLLNVSRILTGNLKIAPRWIDPANVIHAAIESIRPAAMAKNIHLRLLASDSGPVFADPDRLQQVVWNLLTNAVKFTGRNGEVTVEMGRVASHFQISVSDTGQGIPPEFLPHMFDRFSQADSSTTRKFGGLGLGLSIVRHIVEMHGGLVMAHSEGLGRGATLTIHLPIPAARVGEERDLTQDAAASLHGLRVMIVEDERDTREMLREVLQSYGASVVVAASAEEALQQIPGRKPDLVVADLGLPNVDGYELLGKIRSELPEEVRNVPAVALSAFADIEHRERSRLAGYRAHITKPVAVQDLVSILSALAPKP